MHDVMKAGERYVGRVRADGGGGRPRVLLIAEACNPEWESVPLVAYNLYRELKTRAEITLVTQVRNRSALRQVSEPTDRIEFIDSETLARPFDRLSQILTLGRGVGWTTRQALMWLPYLYFEYLVYRQFKDALRSGQFDVIHRLTPLSPTYASPLVGWTDVPFVLGPLNGGIPWPAGTAGTRWKEMEFLTYAREVYRGLPYVRKTYSRAACILAGSRYTLSHLPACARARAVYLPENAVDPGRFTAAGRRPPSQIDPFHILFVGRLVPYKGPDMLLEAFAGSDYLRTQARLTIVGDGPLRSSLETQTAAQGLSDRVTFAGRIPQERIPDFFRQASVFAFPSLREFGGAVVLEAMACGLPCLIVDYGGPAEFVTPDTGRALPLQPRHRLIASIQAALEDFACHRSRLDAMSEAGVQQVAEQYTWTQKARRVVDLYHEILSRQDRVRSKTCLPEDVQAGHPIIR